jgi:hypothetical protein
MVCAVLLGLIGMYDVEAYLGCKCCDEEWSCLWPSRFACTSVSQLPSVEFSSRISFTSFPQTRTATRGLWVLGSVGVSKVRLSNKMKK